MSERTLHIGTLGVLPSLPRVERITDQRAGPTYHAWLGRPERYFAVQISLEGRGAVWAEISGRGAGPGWQPVDPGQALVFDTERHRLAYGAAPGAAGWRFLYINLYGEAARLVGCDLVTRHGHVLGLARDHALVRDLLSRLPAAGEIAATWPAGESARLATEVLAALVDGQTAVPGEPDLVARAMDYLRGRLGEDVGVEHAARHCGISREHLTRVFAAATGEAPARWLRRQRVLLGERLLAGGELTVAEVARRCGFAGSSHFIRLFRARTGRTPGRAKGRGGRAPVRTRVKG